MSESIIQMIPVSGDWVAKYKIAGKEQDWPIALWALVVDADGEQRIEAMFPQEGETELISDADCNEEDEFVGYYKNE
jgi:hypothetical protein